MLTPSPVAHLALKNNRNRIQRLRKPPKPGPRKWRKKRVKKLRIKTRKISPNQQEAGNAKLQRNPMAFQLRPAFPRARSQPRKRLNPHQRLKELHPSLLQLLLLLNPAQKFRANLHLRQDRPNRRLVQDPGSLRQRPRVRAPRLPRRPRMSNQSQKNQRQKSKLKLLLLRAKRLLRRQSPRSPRPELAFGLPSYTSTGLSMSNRHPPTLSIEFQYSQLPASTRTALP